MSNLKPTVEMIEIIISNFSIVRDNISHNRVGCTGVDIKCIGCPFSDYACATYIKTVYEKVCVSHPELLL